MTASAGNGRLKVLFFSQRFPLPMDTGGKIRTGKILEQLNRVFDITLVSNLESPKDDQYRDQINTLCGEFYPVPWKEAKKYALKFYLKVFRSLFCQYPFTVINDYSAEIEAVLCRLTNEKRFDLLICDFLQPSLNFKRLSGTPTLLFEHNVETAIPRRHFENARNVVAKLFWWLQWRRMEQYEKETCRRFTATLTVSEKDKKYLEALGIEKVFEIPTGIDTDYFAPREDQVKTNSLVFTGSMDWLPNDDAIRFFIREVLPNVRQEIPDVSLTVVGRNPSPRLLREIRSQPELKFTGRVDDVRPYLSSHALYIIPLRIGGGTRIKAYEAMAMGKPVISTSVGIEGLPVKHGEHFILADGADSFARGIIKLLHQDECREALARRGMDFVRRNFSWGMTADVFVDGCRKVAARG